MQSLFNPKTIAVIGASERENSVGKKLFENLKQGKHPARIFPVNLRHRRIFESEAFKSVKEIPLHIELAIIAVPAASVPQVMKECANAAVSNVIVISAGFRETHTKKGLQYEAEMLKIARKANMRLLGPNCIGIMSPHTGLNASIARTTALPGNIAFASQSGAMCEAILDWGKKENVGFSSFISVGSMADINWGDLILHLGDDPHTRAILLYMESIGNARRFLSAAREVAYTKPIIVIKAGQTPTGAAVAATHTGSMAGTDAIYNAAFRRSGVLRVATVGELFFMASVLSKQGAARSNRLAVVTNAGGPAILATDALVKGGGQLAAYGDELCADLQKITGLEKSLISNPLDLGSFEDGEMFEQVLKRLMDDRDNDGLQVIITPQINSEPARDAERLVALKRNTNKALVASVLGGESADRAIEKLNKAGIPTFLYPDSTARIFNYMWRYSYNLRGIYETPRLPKVREGMGIRQQTQKMLEDIQREGRSQLTELESKQILKAYELPVNDIYLASNEDEAVAQAIKTGFPVVLKVNSDEVVHKAREGGVMLNLQVKKSVRQAYQTIRQNIVERRGEPAFKGVTVQPMFHNTGLEMIIGSKYDPQFGPVILFGNGGRIVEIYQDNALGLPPLNTTLAHRMLEQTRIYHAIKAGPNYREAVMQELEQVLVQFSQLVAEHPSIKEIDINPVAVTTGGIKILDAQVILHPPGTSLSKLTPLAIRPYPSRYESPWVTRQGIEVNIRPIKPEDEPLVIKFHKTLSDESVYLRYFHSMSYTYRVSHERLARICFIDYDREVALVAIKPDPENEQGELMGVGRIVKYRTTNEAEFSMTINDENQGIGLGSEFMRRLIQICKDEKIEKIVADILPNNMGMRKVCEKFGFKFRMDFDEQVLKAWLDISW